MYLFYINSFTSILNHTTQYHSKIWHKMKKKDNTGKLRTHEPHYSPTGSSYVLQYSREVPNNKQTLLAILSLNQHLAFLFSKVFNQLLPPLLEDNDLWPEDALCQVWLKLMEKQSVEEIWKDTIYRQPAKFQSVKLDWAFTSGELK